MLRPATPPQQSSKPPAAARPGSQEEGYPWCLGGEWSSGLQNPVNSPQPEKDAQRALVVGAHGVCSSVNSPQPETSPTVPR